MRKTFVVVATAALLTAALHSTVRADAVADCAVIQGKAVVTLFKNIFKESVRACGNGFATAAQPVSRAAAGATTGKFLVGIGKGIDQFGQNSCGLDFLTAVPTETVLTTMQSLADTACLVP